MDKLEAAAFTDPIVDKRYVISALEQLEKIPSTTVTSQGQRLDRLDLAPVEVAALAKLGRRRPAQLLARRAVERDIAPGAPAILVECFTEEQLSGILAKASPRLWRELVQACVLGCPPTLRSSRGSWVRSVVPLGSCSSAEKLMIAVDAAWIDGYFSDSS